MWWRRGQPLPTDDDDSGLTSSGDDFFRAASSSRGGGGWQEGPTGAGELENGTTRRLTGGGADEFAVAARDASREWDLGAVLLWRSRGGIERGQKEWVRLWAFVVRIWDGIG